MLREPIGAMKTLALPRYSLLLALAVLALVGLGAAIGLVLAPKQVPAPLMLPLAADAAPVVVQNFSDDHDVQLRVVYAPALEIHALKAGRITAWRCAVGGAWTSGTAPVEVDGSRLVALATRVPPWRDLGSGDRGTDVLAIQSEFKRLGLRQSASGKVDSQTLSNWAQLAGVQRRPTAIPMASLIWLPSTRTRISACHGQLGALSDPSQSLATEEALVESASIASQPPNAVAGLRQIVSDGVVAPVDQHGAVVGVVLLQELAATPNFRQALLSNGQLQPTATWQLRRGIAVAPVPPGAVVGLGTHHSCVVGDDGRQAPVVVVSSLAGRSMVEFLSVKVPGSVQTAPTSNSCS